MLAPNDHNLNQTNEDKIRELEDMWENEIKFKALVQIRDKCELNY
jgi:hypothetical protein